MPIYEYRCTECGCEKEYLQKVSEPLKTQCPECGRPTLQKKLTAAGFQLKGSGWYATDFRDSKKPEAKKPADKKADGETKPSANESKTGGESKAGDGKAQSSQASSKPSEGSASSSSTSSSSS